MLGSGHYQSMRKPSPKLDHSPSPCSGYHNWGAPTCSFETATTKPWDGRTTAWSKKTSRDQSLISEFNFNGTSTSFKERSAVESNFHPFATRQFLPNWPPRSRQVVPDGTQLEEDGDVVVQVVPQAVHLGFFQLHLVPHPQNLNLHMAF